MIRWPWVSRRKAEQELATARAVERQLRERIRILRSNMAEAKWRMGFNCRIADNVAAINVLANSLIRDLEQEQS